MKDCITGVASCGGLATHYLCMIIVVMSMHAVWVSLIVRAQVFSLHVTCLWALEFTEYNIVIHLARVIYSCVVVGLW